MVKKPELRSREGKYSAGTFVCPYCGQEFPGPDSLDWHKKICGMKK